MDEIVPPSEKNMVKRFICEYKGIRYYQLHPKAELDKEPKTPPKN